MEYILGFISNNFIIVYAIIFIIILKILLTFLLNFVKYSSVVTSKEHEEIIKILEEDYKIVYHQIKGDYIVGITGTMIILIKLTDGSIENVEHFSITHDEIKKYNKSINIDEVITKLTQKNLSNKIFK